MAYARRKSARRGSYRASNTRSRSSYRSRARTSRTRGRRSTRSSGGGRTVRIVIQTVPAVGQTAEAAVKPRVAMF